MQPPVFMWMHCSGLILGALGIAWRKGIEMAELGPKVNSECRILSSVSVILIYPVGQYFAHAPQSMQSSLSIRNGVDISRLIPLSAKANAYAPTTSSQILTHSPHLMQVSLPYPHLGFVISKSLASFSKTGSGSHRLMSISKLIRLALITRGVLVRI